MTRFFSFPLFFFSFLSSLKFYFILWGEVVRADDGYEGMGNEWDGDAQCERHKEHIKTNNSNTENRVCAKTEAGRRDPMEGRKSRREMKQGGAIQKARHKDPKDLLRRTYPGRAADYGPACEKPKAQPLFQGGPSYGLAEGPQGSQPYLAKEDANLVPVGVASQRSDVPHIRNQLGQVLAAAVDFCFPM